MESEPTTRCLARVSIPGYLLAESDALPLLLDFSSSRRDLTLHGMVTLFSKFTRRVSMSMEVEQSRASTTHWGLSSLCILLDEVHWDRGFNTSPSQDGFSQNLVGGQRNETITETERTCHESVPIALLWHGDTEFKPENWSGNFETRCSRSMDNGKRSMALRETVMAALALGKRGS